MYLFNNVCCFLLLSSLFFFFPIRVPCRRCLSSPFWWGGGFFPLFSFFISFFLQGDLGVDNFRGWSPFQGVLAWGARGGFLGPFATFPDSPCSPSFLEKNRGEKKPLFFNPHRRAPTQDGFPLLIPPGTYSAHREGLGPVRFFLALLSFLVDYPGGQLWFPLTFQTIGGGGRFRFLQFFFFPPTPPGGGSFFDFLFSTLNGTKKEVFPQTFFFFLTV